MTAWPAYFFGGRVHSIPDNVRSVLVVKLSSLGDVLLGTAILPYLAGRWPGVAIDWAVESEGAALLDGNPFIRKRILVKRREMAALLPWHPVRALQLWRVCMRDLREYQYDLIIDIQGLAKSWVVLQRARCRADGLRIGKGHFPGLDVVCPHRRCVRRHAVSSYYEPFEIMDGRPLAYPLSGPVFVPAKSAQTEVAEIFFGEQPPARYVIFHPWTTWPTKHWPEEHWVGLGRALLEQGATPVISGAGDDVRRAEALAERIGCAQSGKGAIAAAGKLSFAGFAELAGGAWAVISVDSLPMHLAAAVGARVISLHGPTDPMRTGPWGRRALGVNVAGVFLSAAVCADHKGPGAFVNRAEDDTGDGSSLRLVQGDKEPPWRVVGMHCSKMPCLEKTCPRYKTECMRVLTPEKVLSVLA